MASLSLDSLSLVDIETSNGLYTWNNRKSGIHNILRRPNHFLITDNLMTVGSQVEDVILTTNGSDHWPISLTLGISEPPNFRPFHFENFWFTHMKFQQNIESWCKTIEDTLGTLMYQFQQWLKKKKAKLKVWNKEVFGNIHQAKTKLKKQMIDIQQQIILQGRLKSLVKKELLIKTQLEEWYA